MQNFYSNSLYELKVMDSNPCQKRLKNEFIDRISDLPDSILGEILSRLPVKNVVATSILSTRWKTLFPNSVPLTELVIDDSYMLHGPRENNSSRNFISFVDKLLNVTLRDATCVEKVVLDCEKDYGDDKIVSWVRAALQLNIVHLRLMSDFLNAVLLFNSLHGCTTLVELELGREFLLYLPGEFSLPNLKRLLLEGLTLRDNVRKLIAGCPVLDDLSIVYCGVEMLKNLYVQHPFITKLIIKDCSNDWGEGVSRVVIDAPHLETFVHRGQFVSKYVCKNVKSLHSVCIDYDVSHEDITRAAEFLSEARRLAKLVKACSRTTHLCLYGNSMMALYCSSVRLPAFQKLTCLTLGYMGSHGWKMLAQFLTSAPNLAVLTLAEQGLLVAGFYAGFKSKLPSVPICLEQRLEKIEFWKFEWTPDEIDLIEYFLKNGRVLQELIVHCFPYKNTSNVEKLSVLPRHSKACQVLIMEKNDL